MNANQRSTIGNTALRTINSHTTLAFSLPTTLVFRRAFVTSLAKSAICTERQIWMRKTKAVKLMFKELDILREAGSSGSISGRRFRGRGYVPFRKWDL